MKTYRHFLLLLAGGLLLTLGTVTVEAQQAEPNRAKKLRAPLFPRIAAAPAGTPIKSVEQPVREVQHVTEVPAPPLQPLAPQAIDAQPYVVESAPHGAPWTVMEEYPRDCKGHRYGYPYCISGQCATAAPYGDPCSFHYFERPFGSLFRAHFGAQVANGIGGRLVLYRYDFHPADTPQAAQLTSRGKYQVQKMARVLSHNVFPLLIEPSGASRLDEARRQQVISALLAQNILDAGERVVVKRPAAIGLDGNEALDIYNNQLIQTQSSGSAQIYGVGVTGGDE